MTLLKIQPDKSYSIVEERLRFSVPADLPMQLVPFYSARDIREAIEIFERHRDWILIDRIPDRIQFCGKPCCSRIALGYPGQPLPISYEFSKYQGDTDDAHNFGEMSNPGKRVEEDDLVDMVAIVHFWQPVVYVDRFEPLLTEKDGFISPENMPDMTPVTEQMKLVAGR